MATTNHPIFVQSIGVAWRRAVELWSEWVQDDTITMAFSMITAQDSRGIRCSKTVGADTDQYDLLCLEVRASASLVPTMYLFGAPGFLTCPRVLADTYGSNNVKTLFNTHLKALRAALINALCGTGSPSYTEFDASQNIVGYKIWRYTANVLQHGVLITDGWQLTLRLGTMNGEVYADAPALPSPAVYYLPPSAGGGGGITEEQGERIAEALELSSNQRLEMSMNHGAVVVTATTSTEIEP